MNGFRVEELSGMRKDQQARGLCQVGYEDQAEAGPRKRAYYCIRVGNSLVAEKERCPLTREVLVSNIVLSTLWSVRNFHKCFNL